MTEKKTFPRSVLVFNSLRKLTKIFKNLLQQVLFHFSRGTGSIKIFSKYKNWEVKKFSWDKFAKKKRFRKIFCSIRNFLELQSLCD